MFFSHKEIFTRQETSLSGPGRAHLRSNKTKVIFGICHICWVHPVFQEKKEGGVLESGGGEIILLHCTMKL